MGRDRRGSEIGEVRAVELGEDAFARHLLEIGADRFDGIELEAAAARFGDGALRNLFAVRAPQVHLDAVLLLECLEERAGFARRERGIEDDYALAASLLAVRTALKVERIVRRLCVERRREEERERCRHGHTIG